MDYILLDDAILEYDNGTTSCFRNWINNNLWHTIYIMVKELGQMKPLLIVLMLFMCGCSYPWFQYQQCENQCAINCGTGKLTCAVNYDCVDTCMESKKKNGVVRWVITAPDTTRHYWKK